MVTRELVMQPEMKTENNSKEQVGLAHLNWPSSAVEAWKFTPLHQLGLEKLVPAQHASNVNAAADVGILFQDGYLAHFNVAHDGVNIQKLERSNPVVNEWLALLPENHHLSHMARGNMTDIVMVSIAADAKIEQPLHIEFTSDNSATSAHPLVLINLEDGAEAKLMEHHRAENGLSAPVMITRLGIKAKLHLAKLQDDANATTHLGLSAFRLASNAHLNGFTVSIGGKLARLESHVHFDDPNADMALSAIYLGAETQHHDITTVTYHAHPSCASNQVIRGVLADQSHGVFQGKVCVAPDAQKTDGQQMSRVLLLSRDAVADAKPELEIFADDVVCSHGATVGELDEVLMFYLKSRGIPYGQARAMLIQAFLADALEEIEDEALKGFLSEQVNNWTSMNSNAD